MISMRSEKPICAPLRLSEVFPTLPLKRFQCQFVWLTIALSVSSFQGRSSSASSVHASLLQVIDGVRSLALCPQVVFHAPQHFRSSETQATSESCFIHTHARTHAHTHTQQDSLKKWDFKHDLKDVCVCVWWLNLTLQGRLFQTDSAAQERDVWPCEHVHTERRQRMEVIIIDNFCIAAVFSGVHKLTALYNILRHFLSFTNIIHILMTTNNI